MITTELVSQFKKNLAKANMSQADAARKLNVGATHLNQILQGKRRPSLDLLEKMVELGKSARTAS